MIASRETVELLDRHLLPAQAVTHAKVFEVGHQLPLGTLADVDAFDLLVRFDSLGYGAYSENYVLHYVRFLFAYFGAYGLGKAAYPPAGALGQTAVEAAGAGYAQAASANAARAGRAVYGRSPLHRYSDSVISNS